MQERLGSLGPFVAVDKTTSSYWLARNPQNQGLGSKAVNFDPSLRYGSLNIVKGRTDNITASLGDNVYDIGIFFTETARGNHQNYLIAFGDFGFNKTVLNNRVVANPPVPQPLVGYSTPNGRSAQFKTFMRYCFITTDGPGNGFGDVPQKLGLTQVAGYDLTSWQIPPPTQGSVSATAITNPTSFPAGTYLADGSPPPAPGKPPQTWGGGSFSSVIGLTGYYWWRATYYCSKTNQESSPGMFDPPRQIPVSLLLAGQAALLNLTTLGVADPIVDYINIYRVGGTSNIETLIASVPVGTATFIDNTTDANLIGQAIVYHRDPPPNFRAITVHKGCMIGFGYDFPYQYNFTANNDFETAPPQPSDMWIAAFNEPWSFDNDGAVLSADRGVNGDSAVGLFSTSSVLLAFKERTLWGLLGDTIDDFRLIKLFDVGCFDQDTIDGYGGNVFWLEGEAGVYFTDGSTYQNLSDGSGQIVGNIQEALLALVQTPGTKFVGFCGAETYYLMEVTTGTGWKYYAPKQAWSELSFLDFSALVATDIVRNQIFSVDPNNAVTSLFNQVNDYTGTLQLEWQTGTQDFPSPELYKDYAYYVVVMPNGNTADSVEIDTVVDNLLVQQRVLHPRASGSSYYRVGLPMGTKGMAISFNITLVQTGSVPLIVDDLIVYGTVQEQLPPTFDAQFGTS